MKQILFIIGTTVFTALILLDIHKTLPQNIHHP